MSFVRLKKSSRTWIWVLAMLCATTIQASQVSVKPIAGGVIKGSVGTYYPQLLKKYRLLAVKAFSLSEFAEDSSLRRQNNSNTEEVASGFFNGAVQEADTYAQGYCQGLLSQKGVSTGYYLVDQFDVVSAGKDGVRRVITTGNILCFAAGR